MHRIYPAWRGSSSAEANERDQQHIGELERKYGFFAETMGLSPDQLAVVVMSGRLATFVGIQTNIDLSPINPINRLRFAKEINRIFDGRSGTGGPTPNWHMSILFDALDFGWETNDNARLLKATAERTFAEFKGKDVTLISGETRRLTGIVTDVGDTGNLVDRRDYYEQMYTGDFEEDFRFELSRHGGKLMVREHIIELDTENGLERCDLDYLKVFVPLSPLPA